MLYDAPRLRLAGDRGLLVELGDGIEWAITGRAQALGRALQAQELPGLVETILSFRALLILYDPLTLPYARLRSAVEEALAGLADLPEQPSRLVTIPVAYGGEFAPDLDDVARHTGFSPDEVLRRQAAAEYRVFFMGFSPGNAYFGGLPKELATPRLERPRVKVPPGSLGIGGEQISIYPMTSPGGFRLIGRTPVCMYDPERSEPSLLQAGDRVRFRPLSLAEYDEILRSVADGRYQPEIVEPTQIAHGEAPR